MKRHEAAVFLSGVTAVCLALAGCGSGPTYGTGKTSSQQLIDDLSNITSLRSATSNADVDTKPRPALVRPRPGAQNILPPPQESVVRPGSPDWPETPEQRRKRLRDEATANRNNPNYVSPIVADPGGSGKRYLPTGIDRAREREDNTQDAARAKAERAEYKRLKQQQEGGTAAQRKYLSEPPLSYRQPAKTAPIGELGEDEARKERERKAKAKGKSSGKLWPF